MSRHRFPCCDRDGQGKRLGVATGLSLGQEILCRRCLAKTKGFRVATKYFMSRQGVAKTKGPCVATKQFVS